MILRHLRRVQDESFAVSDETLAVLRLVLFGMVLANWRPGTLLWIADYPEWLRSPPPGLTQLASNPPPMIVLYAIDLGIGTAAVLGLLGIRTRISGITFAVLTVIHHSYVFSFGKIDHDFLFVATIFVLSFSGWGNRFNLSEVVRPQNTRTEESLLANSRAVSIQFAVVGVAFFSAGIAKIRGGWLSPGSQMARNWVEFYENIASQPPPLADQALRLPLALWELTDIATVGLELGLVALLVIPRFTRVGVVLLVPFHLGVLVTMGIDFHGYLYVYLPFLTHPDAGRTFARWWDRRSSSAALGICLAAVAGYRLIVVYLVPRAEGAGSRSYLPNLILFAGALLVLRWFVRGPETPRSSRDDLATSVPSGKLQHLR